MRIEVLARKEFEEKYGSGALGQHYTTEEGEHVVVYPEGASTKTKLHELAHAKLEHVGEPETLGEHMRRELAADKWVYEKLGTSPTWSELLADFDFKELFDHGCRPNEVFAWVKGKIEEAGWLELDKEERSMLWWYLRGAYDDWKRRRG